MEHPFSRTRLLIGENGIQTLAKARVAVFGVGGVGGYAVEALARSGVGALDLIDPDRVCTSNLNRQLHATHATLGRYKVDAAEERIHDINPDCAVRTYKVFFMPDTSPQFDFTEYDYVIDAIDTVTGKLEIIMRAYEAGVPVISSMGAGNKLDPTAFEVADLYETSVCPLAKVMRQECRKRGIPALKVVYSKEKPIPPREDVPETCESENGPADAEGKTPGRRQTPGSAAFVPSVAGLIIAGEVVKDLLAIGESEQS